MLYHDISWCILNTLYNADSAANVYYKEHMVNAFVYD